MQGAEGLNLKDLSIHPTSVHVTLLWVPPRNVKGDLAIRWTGRNAKAVAPGGMKTLGPNADANYEFARQSNKDFEVIARMGQWERYIFVPADEPKSADTKTTLATRLRAGYHCHVTLAGDGTGTQLYVGQPYTVKVIYDPQHPENSRWQASGQYETGRYMGFGQNQSPNGATPTMDYIVIGNHRFALDDRGFVMMNTLSGRLYCDDGPSVN